tara:strand:+ start:743 stop:973 length:231 start_codon:yes stop_codon:yes gene_type:complete
MITAINKRNQALVTRASKWLAKYNEANDLRNEADDSGDDKAFKKAEALCEKSFNNYLELVSELPLREKKNIEKVLW